MESRYVHKSHNVSVLMYHLVCAAKYRRVVMSAHVDEVLRAACVEIEKRWEIEFLEIGLDRDHAHFLIQSVPTYSPMRIVTTVKSTIAREVFAKAPEVKQKLWGGEFWGEGYFVNTVGQHPTVFVSLPAPSQTPRARSCSSPSSRCALGCRSAPIG